jgi:Tetratricopeptide repeat
VSESIQAQANRAAAHVLAGRNAEALALYAQLLRHSPESAILHYGYGLARQKSEAYELAMTAYEKVIALQPSFTLAYMTKAECALFLNHYEVAIASYDQLISVQLDAGDALNLAQAHMLKAQCALLKGDFLRAWPSYEWRIHFDQVPPNPYYQLPPPKWTLATLGTNQTIFIWSEQGFGDMLQFSRYIHILTAHAATLNGTVFWSVHPSLRRLFEQSFSLPNLIFLNSSDTPPGYDVHASLMSLPLVCGTDALTKIPSKPYLFVTSSQAAVWHEKLLSLKHSKQKKCRIGLVWAGEARTHDHELLAIDAARSIGLSCLMHRLEKISGVQFFSLQKGAPAAQIRTHSLIDWTADLLDWTDTAALVSQLDLVITVDTAVAHLAGGLGVPVWILSRFDGCWRWLENRGDSPWYPSARLFRQATKGDWEDVIHRVAIALEGLLQP